MVSFPKTDAFIVGGGPAGLATAIALRRKGLRVTVADGMRPPIDKACGEGIMPDGLAAAARLGLQLPLEHSFEFRGIRFRGEGASVSAEFTNGNGRGFRRTVLHQALAEQAERCGVDLRWGCPVPGLASIDAKWIIGADGINSRTREWSKLSGFRRDARRYAFRQHFKMAPWTDYVEIHWGSGFQIYITPVASDEVCIALIARDPKLRVDGALQQFPELSARLKGIPNSSSERGSLTASRRLRCVTRANIALVGDASGSVDAISGEGLCLGFHQALALAEAIDDGNLKLYEAAHERLSVRPRLMADFILTMDRSPWIRKRALPALAAHPDLFAGLLSMHVGVARPTAFAAYCVALGWRILTI
jgi:flavin-dependent dehydrogenase